MILPYSDEAKALVDSAFKKMHPTQDDLEMYQFVDVLRSVKPLKNILEIGVAGGGTMNLWSTAANEGAHLVGVDINPAIMEIKMPPKPGKLIEWVIGDTFDPETLRKVKAAFCGEMVDFLFIDGSHEYTAVINDFKVFSPLVRPGGMIGFHDINNCSGPKRFFEENREGRGWFSFINENRLNYHGKPELSFGMGIFIQK